MGYDGVVLEPSMYHELIELVTTIALIHVACLIQFVERIGNQSFIFLRKEWERGADREGRLGFGKFLPTLNN